jgi:hypothetical protein
MSIVDDRRYVLTGATFDPSFLGVVHPGAINIKDYSIT